MTQSRRLCLQAFVVVAMGLLSLARARVAEARTFDCSTIWCLDNCGLSQDSWCVGCGAGVSTQCEFSSFCYFNYGTPFGAYCGFATKP